MSAATNIGTTWTSSTVGKKKKKKNEATTPSLHDLYQPQPTSFHLSAALLLIETSIRCKNDENTDNGELRNADEEKKEANEGCQPEKYVYLVPRSYLTKWIAWADHQTVPTTERSRLRLALRMAAEIYDIPLLSTSPDEIEKPGPIDCASLSLPGSPLLLRPNVVHGKGDDDDAFLGSAKTSTRKPKTGSHQTLPSGDPTPAPLSSISSSTTLPTHRDDGVVFPVDEVKIGCCAVPERFFELLRSVHGVMCDDGVSVSFQNTSHANHRNGALVSLHHHVIQKNAFLESKTSQHVVCPPLPMSDVENDRSNAENSSDDNGNRNGLIGGYAVMSSPPENMAPPRPVEFRRMILSSPTPFATSPLTSTVTNTQMVQTKTIVELYPIKFIYSILGGNGVNILNPVCNLPISPANCRDGDEKVENLLDASHVNQRDIALLSENGRDESSRQDSYIPNTMTSSEFKVPEIDVLDANQMKKSVSSHPQQQQMESSSGQCWPAHGFVLVSRASPVVEALRAVIKAAAPETSSCCVRLWSKIGQTSKRQCKTKGATIDGDGLDVIDLDTIDENVKEETNSNTANFIRVPLSVSEWVKRHSPKRSAAKSIEIVVEVRDSPSSKWPREGLELESRIKVGDFVDAQDTTGKWYEAIVRGITDDTITVHYVGWTSKWDSKLRRRRKRSGVEIKGCLKNAGPPAPLFSHTSCWRDDLQVGDMVEVRDCSSLVQRPVWFRGIVRAIGKDDDVPREIVGGAELEMLETTASTTEGPTEKWQPLLLLERTRQILVEVPQETFNSSSILPSSVPSSIFSIEFPNGDDPLHASQLSPEPPFIRWVNLFGEEICRENTHLPPVANSKPAMITYAHDPSRLREEVLRSSNNIHGAGFVRESMRGVPPAPGSVGLHNLGNSCFLNSILQCLNHIESLTQYFLTKEFENDLNENNPLGSGGSVATAYAALLNDIWGGEYSTLAPRMLKQTVAAFAPQFNNNYQHDSQEFCSFLMDGLHEDLNRVKVKPYVEDVEGFGMEDGKVAIESWRKHLLRHDSIIVDRCQGMHRSHVTCPHCGKESVKFDVYSTISLPLVPAKTGSSIPLAECLKNFTAGEQLDEDNAWYCSSCKKDVCALKKMALWSTPDILILHLKRFTFSASGKRGNIVRAKIKDQVNFPVDGLDLRPFIMGPIDEDSPPVYNLFGVSEHSGRTANSGHYTATVRNSRDGMWYRYNDSNVGVTSGEAAMTGGAYLLFYQRSKGKARWGGLENIMNKRNVDPHGALTTDQDGFTEVKSRRKKNAKSTN